MFVKSDVNQTYAWVSLQRVSQNKYFATGKLDNQSGIYFKVNNGNTRTICEIVQKLLENIS